ncbi:hypothetical protein ACOME3_001653 [Neoechinorhynchus agilis]
MIYMLTIEKDFDKPARGYCWWLKDFNETNTIKPGFCSLSTKQVNFISCLLLVLLSCPVLIEMFLFICLPVDETYLYGSSEKCYRISSTNRLKRLISPAKSTTSSDEGLPFKKIQLDDDISQERLSEYRILLVGVGGVGSELLKALISVGFRRVDIIDLDTIEFSNLNRQFLFRRRDVGKPKATVAKLAAEIMVDGKRYAEKLQINDYTDDVTKLDLQFFEKYQLVLNALDSHEARSYVNKMCILAKIPLIESGTRGHSGQTSAIMAQRTECYDCTAKPKKQISYPACTIRSTPSKLIHCVVWAKALFNQLFNQTVSDVDDDVSPENTDKNDKEKKRQISTHQWATNCDYDSMQIFDKLFKLDILTLLSMENLWEKRTRPRIWSDDDADQTLKEYKLSFLSHFKSLHEDYIKRKLIFLVY